MTRMDRSSCGFFLAPAGQVVASEVTRWPVSHPDTMTFWSGAPICPNYLPFLVHAVSGIVLAFSTPRVRKVWMWDGPNGVTIDRPCALPNVPARPRKISMSYVQAISRVRKILSKCLALIGVLLVFAMLFAGATDACQNECDTADDASCSCACHSPVATPPDTAVALSTDYANLLSGDPHKHILLVVTDIFRPPIA